MQCRLRDRRSRLFSLGLHPCPLRTEIPPDSLNLLIMLCTVEGEISKSLPIFLWGTLFLNISIIFSRICWQTGDPRPIFAPKGLDLSWMLLLYQIIITITCWHQLFQITSLFNLIFGMCCRSEWQERMYIYKWHEVDQTRHEIFCVHIVCNEIQVKVNLEITTFFFYLRFPYCPNFFWFGVVHHNIQVIFFTLSSLFGEKQVVAICEHDQPKQRFVFKNFQNTKIPEIRINSKFNSYKTN